MTELLRAVKIVENGKIAGYRFGYIIRFTEKAKIEYPIFIKATDLIDPEDVNQAYILAEAAMAVRGPKFLASIDRGIREEPVDISFAKINQGVSSGQP